MSELNEINPFKQRVKHSHFAHLMMEYITEDDIRSFIKLGKDYYSVCLKKDNNELKSAFTLRVANGYIEESILDYMIVHINSLFVNYGRFQDPYLLRLYEKWLKVYTSIESHLLGLTKI